MKVRLSVRVPVRSVLCQSDRRVRSSELPNIRVLEVPDEFEYMDPRLQSGLRAAIDPEFEALVAPPESHA